jgi:hypothetical protein
VADDLVDFFGASLPEPQIPNARRGLQLEVAEIRHHDRVIHDRIRLRSQIELKTAWGLSTQDIKSMAFNYNVLEFKFSYKLIRSLIIRQSKFLGYSNSRLSLSVRNYNCMVYYSYYQNKNIFILNDHILSIQN